MNKGFDWDGFKKGDFAVYCRNRNEIRQFLEECDKQGLKWASGDPATDYMPEHPSVCISVCIECNDLRLYYARRRLYEQTGEKIIDYNPEMFKDVNLDTSNLVAADMVNHPPHYNQGKYEVIDIIESITGEKFIGYLIDNVIKYISRYEYKGGATDLEKAAWYLNKAIEVQKGDKDGGWQVRV